ncbi:LamG domain-containing protein, partial [Salmonella enterica]
VTEAGTIAGGGPLTAGGWHLIAATAEGGTVRLFVDRRQVASRKLASAPVAPIATLAPRTDGAPAFAGRIAAFQLETGARSPAELRARA